MIERVYPGAFAMPRSQRQRLTESSRMVGINVGFIKFSGITIRRQPDKGVALLALYEVSVNTKQHFGITDAGRLHHFTLTDVVTAHRAFMVVAEKGQCFRPRISTDSFGSIDWHPPIQRRSVAPGLNGEQKPGAGQNAAAPVNLTVRYIHSATRYQFIQRGCFVHGFDDIPFQEINMSVSSSEKRRCTDRGSRPENALAISPRSATARRYQNAVSTTSAESLAFFSSCASACARVSRWRSYSIVHGWRSASAGGMSVLQPPAQLFVLSISASHFGIPTLHNGGRSHVKPHYRLPPPRRTGIPVPASSEWYGYSHRKCQPATFVDFHCSFHGQKQKNDKKVRFSSTCRFLSFRGIFK